MAYMYIWMAVLVVGDLFVCVERKQLKQIQRPLFSFFVLPFNTSSYHNDVLCFEIIIRCVGDLIQ